MKNDLEFWQSGTPRYLLLDISVINRHIHILYTTCRIVVRQVFDENLLLPHGNTCIHIELFTPT